MIKSDLESVWLLFIKESEAITGIVPFHAERASTLRHVEICKIIANASRFVDPRLVNGLITGKNREWGNLLRSGTEGALRTVIPSAEFMPKLFEQWILDAHEGLGLMIRSSEHDITDWAWALHDRLICIHPFKTGNGRTARLMFNHLRCLLKQKVYVINNEEADKYYSRLEQYREQHFLPSLVQIH